MNRLRKLFFFLVTIFSFCFMTSTSAIAAATSLPANNQINFNSFTGIYHLSRNNKGLSLLTSEETIVADFPAGTNFYGITRLIPKNYQGHSVEVKVLNITDVAGNNIPYKTSTDNSNNLVMTIGDPGINLYGSQTFKINYQTTGVINLGQKSDKFLLNINGRGWDRPFSKVNATLYLPSSFNASLIEDPTCYTVLNNFQNNNCQIKTEKKPESIIITSGAEPLAAHQALVLKLEFAPSTFTNKRSNINKVLLIIAMGMLVATVSIITINKFKNTEQI